MAGFVVLCSPYIDAYTYDKQCRAEWVHVTGVGHVFKGSCSITVETQREQMHVAEKFVWQSGGFKS